MRQTFGLPSSFRLYKLQLLCKMDNHLTPEYLCNLLPPTSRKSPRTHFVMRITIFKSIPGLHFMEARFSLQQYVSGMNSPLSTGMGNHKRCSKDYSLIQIIKYHTTTNVGIVLNKCYTHGFVPNAAHYF